MVYRFSTGCGAMVIELCESLAQAYLNCFSSNGLGEILKISDGSTIETISLAIADAVTVVAVGFLLIVFCLDLMQKTYQDNFNIQQLIGPFCRLVAGIIAIGCCDRLITLLRDLCNSLVDLVAGISGEAAATLSSRGVDGILQDIEDQGYVADAAFVSGVKGSLVNRDFDCNPIGLIVSVCILIWPWLALKGFEIYLNITMLYRNIEFWLRASFVPVACADLLSNGTSSQGLRYVKKIVAVGAQGALIIALLRVIEAVLEDARGLAGSDEAVNSLLGTLANSVWWYMLLVAVLGFMGVKYAKTIANDVFGA